MRGHGPSAGRDQIEFELNKERSDAVKPKIFDTRRVARGEHLESGFLPAGRQAPVLNARELYN